MISKEKLHEGLISNLEKIGLSKGTDCYIASNVVCLARTGIKKNDLLPICLSAFRDIIGPSGTIFSPSASMNLCNTDIPFNLENTPSHNMGAFSEFIRVQPSSVRSLHPFWSISGIGRNTEILDNVSRHSYGVGSPWSRFLDLDVMQINLGIHPSKAVTLIHHVEVTSGVPYRYTKEFIHPIIQIDGSISHQPFYMSVMYQQSNIKKRLALNEHYFNEMEKRSLIKSTTHESGLKMWSFRMRDFYKVAVEFFVKDIYNYLEKPPIVKPYNT